MNAICEICSKVFTHWRYDRTPRFCSRKCRILSKDTIIKCAQCGNDFRVPASKGNRKFCSQACSNRFNHNPDPSKHSIFTCKWCGKQFEDWTYRNPGYCSLQCVSEYGARQPKPSARRPESFITLICKTCGKNYTVHKCQLDKPHGCKYCSKKCMNDAVGIAMRGDKNVNYIDGHSVARGPNWGVQKRAALRRDNYTCRNCGKQKINKRNPDVHHIVKYQDFNGDYVRSNDLSNLITLCRLCHKGVESGKITL